ncbi:hypothetical protein N7486_001706 [Penicillium sp. IBT 16267x]|nr:hypothetical protein N7486_001706 [Penicillium sp. IBT 16267x]
MFLIASYVPAFAKVNAYFAPSQWIHVSIMMWEIFTVFVPIFHVVRLWTLSKKATTWTAKNNSESISMSMLNKSPSPSVGWNNGSPSTLGEKSQPAESLNEFMDGQLQEFVSLSDFSGENIAFLSEVALWKSYWPGSLDDKQLTDAFNQALRIYANFISMKDAKFPLNISSQTLKLMQSVFEQPARSLFGEKSVNTASPFEADPSAYSQNYEGVQMSYDDRYTGDIPIGFDMAIFNDLQEEIKYLVLTNTWPKFVESMRRKSSDAERSDHTEQSEASLRSWISSRRLRLRLFL